jgi:flavin reductase (DIM6/NTAB) family NADH-FMN oxidoreductase RutF
VINLPNPNLWEKVERLVPFTGKRKVPKEEEKLGFRFENDEYGWSGLTPVASVSVQPDRILECPLQIEAKVMDTKVPAYAPYFAVVATKVIHVHAHEDIVIDNCYIDQNQWCFLQNKSGVYVLLVKN